jgi:hypothetical protein
MKEPVWQTSHNIARDLVQRECDPNEVQKAYVYLRTHKDGERFFHFLNTLVQRGQFLMRSGRTLDYYRALLEVCQRHLTPYRKDAEAMQQILGWAARLMRFYMAQQPGMERRPPPRQPRRRR